VEGSSGGAAEVGGWNRGTPKKIIGGLGGINTMWHGSESYEPKTAGPGIGPWPGLYLRDLERRGSGKSRGCLWTDWGARR
jgi:hypothetical protein